MSRVATRAEMTVPTRVKLAESDLDDHQEQFAQLHEELASIRKVLTAILISVTTGVVVAVLTLIVTRT